MSKALKTIGQIAGVVASVAMFIPGGQPVAAIASAVAVAANVGSQLTAKRPPIRGSINNISIGADQPRPMMIGDTYVGGALIHQVGYGKPIDDVPNPYLAMVMDYSAGGPIAGFDTYYADFQPLNFAVGGGATGYFNGILYRSVQLGATPESAALGGFWTSIPDWGAAYKLSGHAALLWSLKWDSKNGKYNSGAPQFGVQGRGVLTWDPRLDSTWPGGSGSHRWVDPRTDPSGFAAAKSTWSYSYRPGLHALRYALGTWERNPAAASDAPWLLTYGVGIPVDGVVVEDFIELENVCDANDWEVSGVLYEPGDKWANLKRILAAGGAEPCWKGGKLGVKITAPRIALDTITRDDLADVAMTAAGAQPRADRYNTVIAKFRSPAHKWEMQQTDEIVVTDYLDTDGEEIRREEPFELVKTPTQAAQLGVYKLFDSREQGPIELVCNPRLRRYAGGDMLELDDDVRDDLGLAESNVVVLKRALDPVRMTVTLTLVTENLLKHIAAMEVTGTAPASITLPTTEELDQNSGVNSVLVQIEALADDGVLTRFEKITKLIPLNRQLEDQFDLLMLQVPPLAAHPAVAAAADDAEAAWDAWTAYRDGLDPAWNDTSEDTAVVRADYDGVLLDLRLALEALESALRAGSAALTALLTNESHTLPADADGTVTSYDGATGDFVIYFGSVDVSDQFTLGTVSGGNPQGLTVGYVDQTYTVTAGLGSGEDSATLTIRATGTGAFTGVTLDKVFSLSKSKAGADGTPPALLVLTSSHQTFRYDTNDDPVAQATDFFALRQNTAEATYWLISSMDGDLLLGGYAADLAATGKVSSVGPDHIAMSQSHFDAFITGVDGDGKGVSVTARLDVTTTIHDTRSVVKIRDGEQGAPGESAYAGILTNEAVALPADSAGNIASYSGAETDFIVLYGAADVTSDFTFAVHANPQALSGPLTGNNLEVTGGFDAGEPSASLTLRATGTGAHTGVTVDKVFSLTKSLAGEDGTPPPLISLEATSLTVTYDTDGNFIAGQTITFTATPQNTTATTVFSLWDQDNNLLSAGTSAGLAAANPTYMSTTGADNLTFTSAGLIAYIITYGGFAVSASPTGETVSDRVSITKVQDGAAGIAPILSKPAVQLDAYADGTLKSGALTNAVGTLKLRQGTTDLSSGVTYSTQGSTPTGITATIDSSGNWAITGCTIDAGAFTFRATYAGANYDIDVSVSKSKQGNAAFSKTGAVSNSTSSNVYAGSGTISGMPTTPGIGIQFTASIAYTVASGSGTIVAKGQYRINGGSWTDFSGSEQTGTTATATDGGQVDIMGALSAGSLSPGDVVDIQVLTRKTVNGGVTVSVGGTMTAAWA